MNSRISRRRQLDRIMWTWVRDGSGKRLLNMLDQDYSRSFKVNGKLYHVAIQEEGLLKYDRYRS